MDIVDIRKFTKALGREESGTTPDPKFDAVLNGVKLRS
jgi:hypothetical protein